MRRRAEVRKDRFRGRWLVELREDRGTFEEVDVCWFDTWAEALEWAVRMVTA